MGQQVQIIGAWESEPNGMIEDQSSGTEDNGQPMLLAQAYEYREEVRDQGLERKAKREHPRSNPREKHAFFTLRPKEREEFFSLSPREMHVFLALNPRERMEFLDLSSEEREEFAVWTDRIINRSSAWRLM